MIEYKEIIMLCIITLAGFLGWLMQTKFKQIETKLQVMGDIRKSLSEIKTDVAVIANKLENRGH